MTQEQIVAIKSAESAAQTQMIEANKRLIILVDELMRLRRACDHVHPNGSSALDERDSCFNCEICNRIVKWKRT